jgi:hypothetical protein
MNTNLKHTLIAFLLLAMLPGQLFIAPQTAAAATTLRPAQGIALRQAQDTALRQPFDTVSRYARRTVRIPAEGTACDAALFVADVTAPDGSIYPPNMAFTKTWRLKNVGSCTWTTAYKLIFYDGAQMGGAMEIPLTATVAPNTSVDLSVNLTAPAANGSYRGYWQLRNAADTDFGIGATANRSFWVDIVVRDGNVTFTPLPPSGMSDDFASSAGVASWQSGAGKLPFPGKDEDSRGFAIKLDVARLETGATFTGPTLLMVPQNKTDGYIQGLYPAQTIQNGDHFQSTIGCQFEAPTSCYVTYRIDYRTSAGVRTLWTFKEKYDGHSYNVNLDLSFLAGKNVEFFLMVLASGSPSGDRALWVAPRITHATPIPPTPSPTITMTPTPRIVNATVEVDQPVYGVCGRPNPVDVVATVTTIAATSVTYHWELVADKTVITPDEMLTFSAAGAQTVAPAGYSADCGINYLARIIITSPSYWSAGIYYSVVEPTSTPLPPPTLTPVTPATPITPGTPVPAGDGYRFATSGGAASWQSGAGALSFPGTDGDARGFALKLETFQMETGAFVNEPSLLMVPQTKTDGYIQGLFPPIAIQNGDRFQATIGCQYGATSCYVTYRIDVRTGAGVRTLWTFRERYDGLTYNVNLDLSSLAGKNAEFFLLVLASGSPNGDRAVWIAPRILHAGGPSPSATVPLPPTLTAAPPTATAYPTGTMYPTVTMTPAPATPYPTGTMYPTSTMTPTLTHPNWLTYTNQAYQFQFQYPPQAQISGQTDNGAHIELPITPGTNLGEKYLDVSVAQNVTVCTSPLTNGYTPGSFTSTQVSINGIAFVKESGADAGAGNLHQWTAYSTLKGSACISLGFVLHSINPGNYPSPPPVFDQNAESVVFEEIMSTFGWLNPQ